MIFSQFDVHVRCTGTVAEKLEKELGIPVLRHTEKKPAGSAEDLEKHFGCVTAYSAACPTGKLMWPHTALLPPPAVGTPKAILRGITVQNF